ncbi:MAG: shikimate dehydrogenase [bacterium]|nr:shikimate dehydrogenase [bacterium]
MGYPVAHSLSPLMQTFAFRHCNLDSLYMPFPVMPERLAAAVVGGMALGLCGFNVTIPHKEAIMAHIDEVSAEARFIGAVNTVEISEGRTIGHNTDGEGFLQPLRRLPLVFAETSACMIGAGGAARAIAMALLQSGCPVLVVANRTYERGQRLVTALQAHFPHADIGAVPYEQAADVASRSALIVNATSLGLHRQDVQLLPSACFHTGQVVYDIVYRPLDTPLLKVARRCGATIVPGIDMLIGQGAEAFRIWTGLAFPVEAVRHVLEPFLYEAT